MLRLLWVARQIHSATYTVDSGTKVGHCLRLFSREVSRTHTSAPLTCPYRYWRFENLGLARPPVLLILIRL